MSSHTPGALKQSNKKHKGSKTSKRAQKRSLGAGKVGAAHDDKAAGGGGGGGEGGKKGKAQRASVKSAPKDSKKVRQVREEQLRQQKRTELRLQKRIGSLDGPPKIIGIIPLSEFASTQDVLLACLADSAWSSATVTPPASAAAAATTTTTDLTKPLTYASYSKHKGRCIYLQSSRDLFSILDVAKASDVIVFAVDVRMSSAESDLVDERALSSLAALRATGCPDSICVIHGIDPLTSTVPQRIEIRKNAQRRLQVALGSSDLKVMDTTETIQLARHLCNMAFRDVQWRSIRSYMATDSFEMAAFDDGSSGKCHLRVSGYLRGMPMSVDSLMHIVGVGTGKILSLEFSPNTDPFDVALAKKGKAGGGGRGGGGAGGGGDPFVVHADATRQESLVLEAHVDEGGITGEQTWPTEAEMGGSLGGVMMGGLREEGTGRSRRNLPASIPEGMSSYQADWFVNDEGKWEENDVDQEEGEESGGDAGDEEDGVDFDDGMSLDAGSLLNAGGGGGSDEKRRLRALAQDDMEFPDEMNTPHDTLARQRFARFRALQSFRTSPWHPKENLPQEYARIFQFENFNGAQRRVLAKGSMAKQIHDEHTLVKPGGGGGGNKKGREITMTEDDESVKEGGGGGNGVSTHLSSSLSSSSSLLLQMENSESSYVRPGQYMSIVIGEVPVSVALRAQRCGYLLLFSLLTHENKLSVVHFNVQRCSSYMDPIKSKERLIMHAGFRTFPTKPIFSEVNLNCDKHKMERFLLPDRFSMASAYAPITFLPCPLLLFKETLDGNLVLVATGSLASVDPDRIVLKKVILTGIPVRVRKRFAVVKHLFYDTQDVRWFKPAELVTKRGLRGHIREPVGTHGLLKASFNGPITQNDTVMLILYKRIFPKMPEEGAVSVC